MAGKIDLHERRSVADCRAGDGVEIAQAERLVAEARAPVEAASGLLRTVLSAP